ncbi:DUF1521 domain-containing protein [Paraburkholderia azotifigens]|uniref:DUF1521 domain-containing protein n=1 Tax=Paraburkholderia azotifigens TaxID=2057004 RepID=A0A5C6VNQ4_9BURK|nr:DUF1521 domain-containing protein [Paraburkholderia azotifigens]
MGRSAHRQQRQLEYVQRPDVVQSARRYEDHGGNQGDGNVTYADKLTITKGNDAYVVNGLSEKNGAPLTVQREGNGRLLDAQTPDGYELVANRSGKGWIDPATGHAPTAADFKAH